MTARIVGLGHPLGGDDAVGPAVVRYLRSSGVPSGVELAEAVEPSAVLPMLEGVEALVVVDAVLDAGVPGRVARIPPESVSTVRSGALSSHGLELLEMLALAWSVAGGRAPRIEIVGVSIASAVQGREGLSAEVAAAVPRAAALALDLARI